MRSQKTKMWKAYDAIQHLTEKSSLVDLLSLKTDNTFFISNLYIFP
jgi:hypothetical protein